MQAGKPVITATMKRNRKRVSRGKWIVYATNFKSRKPEIFGLVKPLPTKPSTKLCVIYIISGSISKPSNYMHVNIVLNNNAIILLFKVSCCTDSTNYKYCKCVNLSIPL